MVSEEFKHSVWDYFASYWLFGLRHPSTGAYRLLLGPNLGKKIQSPAGLTAMHTPQNCFQQCLWPCSAPRLPPVSAGDPPPNTIRQSCPVSHDVTAFYPESQWTQDLWNSCDQTSLTFKARFSEGSSSHCQTPRLVSLTWGLEHLLLWENFWGIIIF